MKKQLIILSFLLWSTAVAWTQTSNNEIGKYGLGYNSYGRRFSFPSVSAEQNQNTEEVKAETRHFVKGESGRLMMKVAKVSLSKEEEHLYYKNKFSFTIVQDIILDTMLVKSLYPNSNQSIIIKQGIYPIIEWDNYYYIRF